MLLPFDPSGEAQVLEVMPEPEQTFDDPIAQPRASLGQVTYDQTASAMMRDGDRRGSIAIDTLNFQTGFPIFFDGPRTMLVVGLNYGLTNFRTDGNVDTGGDKFHTFRTIFTFKHTIDEKWAFILRYVPNLTTNMQDVSFDHVSHGAQAIGTYKLGENETLYFGLAYVPGIPTFVLPGAGYELHRGQLRVELRMPEKAEVAYMLTPRIEAAAFTKYQNVLFGVGGDDSIDHISLTTVWSGFSIDVRIWEGLHLNGQLGRTIFRRYRGRADHQDVQTVNVEQTMMGRLALSYEIDR